MEGLDVVRAGEHDDHFGVNALELAVLHPPQNVLRSVGAPAEIPGIPAEEVLAPVREQVGVLGVAGSPATDDRVAEEINVDPAGASLGQQLLVSKLRVGVAAGDGFVGRNRPDNRRRCRRRRDRRPRERDPQHGLPRASKTPASVFRV